MTASMGTGKNVLYYVCMRRTSFVSCFTPLPVRSRLSVPPRVDLKVSGRSLLPLGLAQQRPARRGMLSRDLLESPNGTQSRRIQPANGHEGINPPPEGLVQEKSKAEGDKNAPLKNLPYRFPGFGPRDSSEQEQIPFSPSCFLLLRICYVPFPLPLTSLPLHR